MKKTVLRLDLPDNESKRKAMKAVATLSGINAVSIDMKAKNVTVVGVVDPVDVVLKLRKIWPTDIISVGEVKEPEKPKEGPKKEGTRKEEAKKEEGKKAVVEKKKEPNEQLIEPVKAYKAYNHQANIYYYSHSMEENPNACAIC